MAEGGFPIDTVLQKPGNVPPHDNPEVAWPGEQKTLATGFVYVYEHIYMLVS